MTTHRGDPALEATAAAPDDLAGADTLAGPSAESEPGSGSRSESGSGSVSDAGTDDTVPAPLPGLDAALRSPEIDRARSSARVKLFGAPADPVKIDRFVVVRRLGGGGMGVVYSAYDPKLDRKVALKLLRPDQADGGGLQQRLFREAQAMAKVSHPHVITVHEVGTVAAAAGSSEQVFVAMEFVDGQTLGHWVRAQPRSWSQLRRMFLAIGRGLEAAHAAGLVHRDFKPDNVMIDAQDRPRVLDFGLARVGAARATAEPKTPHGEDLSLTRTGVVMGTPAYMAAEQHRSARVDARADQFSFCVSLFEAVYGRRPFSGKTYAELSEAVVSGTIELPEDRGNVPARAFGALQRGLRPDPDERFESMDPLLTSIAYDPSHARQRWLLGAGVVALVAGTAVAADELGDDDPACANASATLDRAWSRSARRGASAAFTNTGKPYAAEAWTATEASLDAFTNGWIAVHDSVCSGAAPELPETERLGRLACLEWRAQELDALTDLLAVADGDIVERAAEIVGGVTDPSTCASPAAQRATARLPSDPAQRATVLERRAELAHAQGLRDAGKYGEAKGVIDGVRNSDVADVHPALGAEASLRLGQLLRATGDLQGAETALQTAVYDALAGERDDLAFAAALELLWVIGSDRVDFERARPWMRFCEALRPRQDEASSQVAQLDLAVGSVLAAAGRHKEARQAFEVAVTARRADGSPHDVIETMTYLARSKFGAGQHDDAITLMDDALAIAEAEAPDAVAGLSNRLGDFTWKLGRYHEAGTHYNLALRRVSKERGAEHPALAGPLRGLSRVAWATGDKSEAMKLSDRVLALSGAGRIDDRALVETLEVRALVYAARRDHQRAAKAINRALAIGRRHGVRHPMQAFVFAAQAEVARLSERPDDALADLEQARTLLGPGYGPGDPRRHDLATAVGLSLLAKGDQGRGRDVLQRARRGLMECCANHYRLPQIEAALSQPVAAADPSGSTESKD